ncbi:hypothetical protein PU02_0703 [Bartonella ancashensis]|uniref:Uncharacterized protein n=1 Tax=Bartonella ancashensis TaxID=1318743 RepID=A0A0M4M5W4_9HYPH|nr:hypothetical protein PU02_0703 [Bartonella ancashensis]
MKQYCQEKSMKQDIICFQFFMETNDNSMLERPPLGVTLF